MRPLTDGVLVETDVLIAFLTTPGTTVLHRALSAIPCYTTVVNAAELLGAAESEDEVRTVRAALSGLHVLGLSARYAFAMGRVARSARAGGAPLSTRDAVVIGTAVDARLPVLTIANAEKFRAVDGVTVVTPDEIDRISSEG